MYHEAKKGCTAVFGAMTRAMRAQEILARAAIRTELIKTESPAGCVYGLSYSCTQEKNVRTVLSGAKIRVRAFVTEEA